MMRMIFQIGKKTVHVGIELSSMKLERIFVIVSLRIMVVTCNHMSTEMSGST